MVQLSSYLMHQLVLDECITHCTKILPLHQPKGKMAEAFWWYQLILVTQKQHQLIYHNVTFFQISKALAGADRKDLMRRLPKFIYDEEKALEVKHLFIYLWETAFCVPKLPIFFFKISFQDAQLYLSCGTILMFKSKLKIVKSCILGFKLMVLVV